MISVLRFLRTRDLYYTLTRYALAALMMSFGMLKILGMQFNTIRPFATWSQPLEKLSGQQLTWAFMGHSSAFQVMTGLFEFVPASLLLFRRTTLAGALLLLPMTIGVFLINFQFGLWTNTKMDAAFMLAANVALLLFDSKRLGTMLLIATNGKRIGSAEIATAIAVTTLVVLPRLLSNHYRDDRNILTGDWYHNGPYVYSLACETENGQLLPHHNASIFFGPNNEYSEVNDSSRSGSYKQYKIDSKSQTIEISPEEYGPWRGNHYTLGGHLSYSISTDTLRINGSASHTWTFIRRVIKRNTD